MNSKHYIFIILLLFCKTLWAQSLSLEWFRHEDGLPNDLVKSVQIDKDGYVWVATDDGVIKMEGRNFIQVSTPELFSNNFKNLLFTQKYGVLATADPGLLTIYEDFAGIHADHFYKSKGIDLTNKVFYPKTLYEARDSSIWLADLKKVFKIESERMIEYTFPEKNHTDHFSRSFQFLEVYNSFYVLSQKGYLYRLDTLRHEFVELDWAFSGIEVYSVLKTAENAFYIGCEKGLVRLQFDDHEPITSSTDLNFSLPISCLIKKNTNAIILGTWNFGAYEMAHHNGITNFKPIQGTEQLTINDIKIDFQNQLWFGTNHGVCLLRQKVFSVPFQSLTNGYIQDIVQDVNGINYFTDGKTIYKVDKELNTTIFLQSNAGLIIVLSPVKDGIWMGTNTGLIIFKSFTGKITEYDYSYLGQGIYNLCIDKEKTMWFIQNSSGVQKLFRRDKQGNIEDLTPELSGNEKLRMLKLSPDGELYIGAESIDKYLLRYNYTNQTIENISLAIDTNDNKLIAVNDIGFMDEETIYLATKKGTFLFKNGAMELLNVGDMANEMVTALAFDAHKNIYLANSNGIVKYHNGTYIIFDNNDGLPAKTIHYRCLNVDSYGNLWAGTISGVGMANTNFQIQTTPKPEISRLEKSGQIIPLVSNNKFLNSSLLNFTFATPVYPSKHVRYQYALVKYNASPTVWIDVLPFKDNIILSNLNQADYKLYVRAKYRGNYNWSTPLIYSFTVSKSWYLQPVYLVLIYMVIFVSVYFYVLFHKRKSERENQKLELIISDRTRKLVDQNEELKQLNINLQQAKEESEAAIKAKDHFFSILAHDLKSPFNALIGFSQLLVHNRDEISEVDMHNLFVEMLKVSENTYKLLENLLDWARSQTGNLKVDFKELLVDELFSDILPVLESTARQKGIVIKTKVEPNIVIWADTAVFAIILRNLVSNAIKFSNPETEIMILASKMGELAHIEIIDQGIGIPPDKLDLIFTLNEKFSTKGTSNEMGTGLGLVLCRDFVQKINGTIHVNSAVGIGTTFSINLPLVLEKC